MSSDPRLDLNSMSLADLMAGLEQTDQPAHSSAESWLLAEGWTHGSTRVLGTELYPKYLTWLEAHPSAGKTLGVRAWGKVMSSRFKKGRAASGFFYYMSRETNAQVVGKLVVE